MSKSEIFANCNNGRAMRAPTMLRKKGTAHYAAVPVGARIVRPRFVLNDCFIFMSTENPRRSPSLSLDNQAPHGYTEYQMEGECHG